MFFQIWVPLELSDEVTNVLWSVTVFKFPGTLQIQITILTFQEKITLIM